MVSMMNNKIIFLYIISVSLVAVLLFAGGCKPGPGNIDDESMTDIEMVENDSSEEQDPENENDPIEEEIETADQEDGDQNGEADIDTETVENEDPPESVELSAEHVGGDPGSITMVFDLITGEVSGYLEIEYTEVSLDGNQTVLCKYIIEGDINGTLDLESRIINAEFTGEADSEDRGCYKGELKFSMKGKISEGYSAARGTTTYGGIDWSVWD